MYSNCTIAFHKKIREIKEEETNKKNCIIIYQDKKKTSRGIKVHVHSFKFHIWLNFFSSSSTSFPYYSMHNVFFLCVSSKNSGAGGQEFALLFVVHILTFISMSRSKTNAEFFFHLKNSIFDVRVFEWSKFDFRIILDDWQWFWWENLRT